MPESRTEKVAVIGLGYVGLPIALALAREFPCVGFDVATRRIEQLRAGEDVTGEANPDELRASKLELSSDPKDLADVTFFVVAVPTPIDEHKRPNLQPLLGATQTVGKAMRPGAVVVYESTVYPGLTEEICGPALEEISGLVRGRDFKLGYSPERINPGDTEHRLETITKIVAAEDDESLERVAAVYGRIINEGLHRAPSIKVAEAAKVIENTQRDLNIALMNELSLIFDRMGIRTVDVLEAAETKWNFLRFRPGLVGGHCIGVDPYYLTTKAEQLDYHPQVILAGRRINDGMGRHVARTLVKLLIHRDIGVRTAKVAVLGLAFKENVGDLRNSRVPDIVRELRDFGVEPLVYDPLATEEAAYEECGVTLCAWSDVTELDGLILAVPHRAILDELGTEPQRVLRDDGIFIDVKSAYAPGSVPDSLIHWSL